MKTLIIRTAPVSNLYGYLSAVSIDCEFDILTKNGVEIQVGNHNFRRAIYYDFDSLNFVKLIFKFGFLEKYDRIVVISSSENIIGYEEILLFAFLKSKDVQFCKKSGEILKIKFNKLLKNLYYHYLDLICDYLIYLLFPFNFIYFHTVKFLGVKIFKNKASRHYIYICDASINEPLIQTQCIKIFHKIKERSKDLKVTFVFIEENRFIFKIYPELVNKYKFNNTNDYLAIAIKRDYLREHSIFGLDIQYFFHL